ncbi:MAG: hybrid sensor histidine kinase/response regulator [Anaerolineae bacterium]|nr:hybrid sensor histidine kinase/response regulator [Anaerolineae bacterium]
MMDDQHNANNNAELIMFVDDNAALLSGMGQLLKLEGYKVVLAEDGVEALRKLNAAQTLPHLIISDIAMPNMDGFQLAREIRSRRDWASIQFLFLTAFDQPEYMDRAYESDPEAYLVKPFDEKHLLRLIRSRLRRREEWLQHIKVQQDMITSAKQDLATMVSHELRTPLVSMNIVTDMLSADIDNMDGDQVRDLLDMMQGGSVRLTRLVEQMVMYVQLRSGALTDSLRGFFRPRLVSDAIMGAIKNAQQFDYRQRGIPVEQISHDLDVWINCDLNSLRHAIAEIILNAMAFSKPAQTVLIQQTVRDGYVQISVCDQGPGIDPDDIENVFNPFYQVNRAKMEQQGIGIGLTLAKEIIEAHDGKLTLQSQVGQGTEVVIALPVYPMTEA